MSEDKPDSQKKNREADGGITKDIEVGTLEKWGTAILPLVLLGIVLVGFVAINPLGEFQKETGEPLPEVSITKTEVPNQEEVVLHVTNNTPREVTISQVLVDEAYWSYEIKGSEDNTLGRGESARIIIPYHWYPGFDYEFTIVLGNGATFHHTIPAIQETPEFDPSILWSLAVLGLFVGIIPIVIGMLWFPYMRTMSQRALHGVLAFSMGVLGFLMFDAFFESFELSESIPSILDGKLIVILGALGAFLLIEAVSSWGSNREKESSGLQIAYLVALGIGFHNLAEGLAIGSSFAVGRLSLGTFLVVGFMLHNVTEGPAVVAPVARGERPSVWHFGALGVIAGAPVIFGGWLGGYAYSPVLATVFIAVGVGAILQVIWEISQMISSRGELGTATNLIAFFVGLVVMYVTDLLVAV